MLDIWPHWHRHGGQGQHTVVLLHGFMGRRQDWSPLVAGLPEQLRYLAFDLPGHGQHHTGQGVDIPQMASGLWAQLTRLGLEQVTLLGYSMGGRVALEAAAQEPARTRALILESSSPGLEEGRQERVHQDQARAQRLRQDFAGFLEAWYGAPLFASLAQRPALLRQHIQQILRWQDPAQLARVLESASPGLQPPRWDFLPAFSGPLACLAGERDLRYRDIMARAAQQSRQGHYVLCQGAGHNIHLEDPAAWQREVAALLHSL